MLATAFRRAAALGLGLALLGAAGSATAAAEGAIKYRQSVMMSVGGHTGAIAQIVFGKVEHRDHLSGHAHALAELAKYVNGAFKERAAKGKTRAKPAIWKDWSGFQAKARDFEGAAADFAAATRSGGDLPAAFKAMTETCKACHKEYRKKRQ